VAEESYPFDAAPGQLTTEDQWSKMTRRWTLDGVVGTPGDTSLKIVADGTILGVKLQAGEGQVRGHHYRNSAELNKLVASNSSGNPRIDRVVMRLDPSANTITSAVIQGTPAGSPTPPALTQVDSGTWEESVGQVRVENGVATIASGKETDERRYCPARVRPMLSTLRPTSTGDLVGLETDTDRLIVPDGAGGWRTAGWHKTVLKTADENAPLSSTTLQNDNELFLPVVAQARYRWRALIKWAAGTTCDIKFDLSLPAAANHDSLAFTFDRGGGSAFPGSGGILFDSRMFSGTDSMSIPGAGSSWSTQGRLTVIEGWITVGATAGNAQIRFSQNTSHASETAGVSAGSTMELHRVA
jgi:hypothetical protein